MKVGLGAAQFGMTYGINNHQIQLNLHEIKSILDYALQHQISILDTAPVYGQINLFNKNYLEIAY